MRYHEVNLEDVEAPQLVLVEELQSSLQTGFTEQTEFPHCTLTYPRAPLDLNSRLLAYVTIRYIPCDAFS